MLLNNASVSACFVDDSQETKKCASVGASWLTAPARVVQRLRPKTSKQKEVYMLKITQLAALIFLTIFTHRAVFADMVSFDFDDIQSQSKKGPKAPDVEIYMEGLYGSNISVSQNTAFGRTGGSAGASLLQSPSSTLGISNGFLSAGKGRGAGISIDFGENPIHSFSVDWLLRKGGKSFTILADGVVINQQALTKTQKKAGLSGHQDSYFFDDPVHKLEFIGLKKKSFAIDNLVINIPLPGSDETEDPENSNEGNEGNTNQAGGDPNNNENPGENNLPLGLLDNPPAGDTITQVTAAVPEPSSILMLVLGLCGAWLWRRGATV
jgi:hypothetical protein